MDTNKDGVIDQEEFVAAGGSKEEFEEFDLDGDGVLDQDELRMRKMVAEERRMDVNNDGKIDQGELLAAGGSKEEFDTFDLDGDGVLDEEELCKRRQLDEAAPHS